NRGPVAGLDSSSENRRQKEFNNCRGKVRRQGDRRSVEWLCRRDGRRLRACWPACVAPLLAPNGRLYSPANKSVRATTTPQTPSEKLNRGGNRHGSDRRDRFGALVPHA